MMNVKVLFFGGLRERLGLASTTITLPANALTVADLRDHLTMQGAGWMALAQTKNLRAAVNQKMATMDLTIVDGDEIAFFPPVTGG